VDHGTTKRRVGLGLGAVGLAGIAVGIVYTLKVGSDDDDYRNTCLHTGGDTCSGSVHKTFDDRGHHDQAISIGAYALGGAALVGGGILYYLGHHDVEHPVAVVPTRSGAMLTASGRF